MAKAYRYIQYQADFSNSQEKQKSKNLSKPKKTKGQTHTIKKTKPKITSNKNIPHTKKKKN